MDRDKFNRILRGYWDSQVLISALKLGIFDSLSGREDTALGVSGKLGLDLRGTTTLLNALVALGFVRKRKNLYKNNKFSEKHLAGDSEESLSGFVLHNSDMWESWGDLPHVIKKGAPRIGYSVTGCFTGDKSLYNFARAMHQGGKGAAPGISKLFDFSKVRSIIDIGGCTGRYALAIMKVSLAEKVYVVDLPLMVKEARKIIREEVEEELSKIKFLRGSFFEVEPHDQFDLAILSNIIHSLSDEGCLKIFRRSRGWLSKGGKLLVHDLTVNDSGVMPPASAMFAVNMLANTLEGKVYTERAIIGILKEAGFNRFEKRRTSSGNLALLCG